MNRRQWQDFIVKRQQEDLRNVLSSREGRRVMWRIINAMAGYGDAYRGTDDAAAHHLHGKRGVAVDLLNALQEADGTAASAMVTEAFQDAAEANQKKQAGKAELDAPDSP